MEGEYPRGELRQRQILCTLHSPLPIIKRLVLAQYLSVLDVLKWVRKLAFVPFRTMSYIAERVIFYLVWAIWFIEERVSERDDLIRFVLTQYPGVFDVQGCIRKLTFVAFRSRFSFINRPNFRRKRSRPRRPWFWACYPRALPLSLISLFCFLIMFCWVGVG